MSAYIRTCRGKPILRDFVSGDGTPIVIDVISGIGYYLYKNRVLPLVGGTPVIFGAFTNAFSNGFANGP